MMEQVLHRVVHTVVCKHVCSMYACMYVHVCAQLKPLAVVCVSVSQIFQTPIELSLQGKTNVFLFVFYQRFQSICVHVLLYKVYIMDWYHHYWSGQDLKECSDLLFDP